MTFRDPASFATDIDGLEDVERATTRFVTQGIAEVIPVAADQFTRLQLGTDIGDRANYLGEDITRLALEQIGAPKIPGGRLFGTTDYKLATYQFLPAFAVRQALFVDSKAEKNAMNVARVQVTQTSLTIRQYRSEDAIEVAGKVPRVWTSDDGDFLTTTIFVKYHYGVRSACPFLRQVTVIALPNGFLQERYNPSAAEGIWNVGPDSPARGEKFRTRVNFRLLEQKAPWRVQRLAPHGDSHFRD